MRAFERLVGRHQERILANCRYLTRSPADAEDLAQEVFVKAYFAIPRFEGRSAFKTWLQKIKINHCLNFLQKLRGKSFVEIDDPDVDTEADPEMRVAPTAERKVATAGHRERISAVLDELTDTLRVPLILRELDGLSYEEIARTLGIGLSATKMRIKRAREEFRRLFGEDLPFERCAGDSDGNSGARERE